MIILDIFTNRRYLKGICGGGRRGALIKGSKICPVIRGNMDEDGIIPKNTMKHIGLSRYISAGAYLLVSDFVCLCVSLWLKKDCPPVSVTSRVNFFFAISTGNFSIDHSNKVGTNGAIYLVRSLPICMIFPYWGLYFYFVILGWRA